jgi:hypothetical protein
VSSSYTESAHIPLAKVTSRNTQKRAISFTKQAAHQYLENLVVASMDVDADNKCDAHSKAAGQPDILRADGKGGRHFNLSWKTGNELPACCWTHPSSNDNPETAHLSTRVMDVLSHNCLPRMQRRQLPCFTMFTDGKGNKYRAHPCYDGKAWNKKIAHRVHSLQ